MSKWLILATKCNPGRFLAEIRKWSYCRCEPAGLQCATPHVTHRAAQAAMVSWAEIMVRRRADPAARADRLQDADRQLQAILPGVTSSHKNLLMV